MGAHCPKPDIAVGALARLLVVPPGYRAAMNAITLLKNDHKTVEDLFRRFEKLGPRAVKSKQDVVERIVRELSIHAAIEEMLFYPAIREVVEAGDVDDMVLESLEEHHLFPKVNKLLGRQRLDELGEAMTQAKKTVPTHPHPRSPDEPPGNLVAGAGAALVDKALDTGRKLVRQKVPSAGRPSRPRARSRP